MSNKNAEFGNLAMLIGGKIIQVISSPEKIGIVWGIVIEFPDKSTKAMFFLSDFEGNTPGAWSIE